MNYYLQNVNPKKYFNQQKDDKKKYQIKYLDKYIDNLNHALSSQGFIFSKV